MHASIESALGPFRYRYMVGMMLFQLLATNIGDHPFLNDMLAHGAFKGTVVGKALRECHGQMRPNKGFDSSPAEWRELTRGLLCFDVSSRWGLDKVLRSQAFAESASVHLAGLSSHPRLHGEMHALRARMELLGVQLVLQPQPAAAPEMVCAAACAHALSQREPSMAATGQSLSSGSGSSSKTMIHGVLVPPTQVPDNCMHDIADGERRSVYSSVALCVHQCSAASVQSTHAQHTAGSSSHSWPGSWPQCNMQTGSCYSKLVVCRVLSTPCSSQPLAEGSKLLASNVQCCSTDDTSPPQASSRAGTMGAKSAVGITRSSKQQQQQSWASCIYNPWCVHTALAAVASGWRLAACAAWAGEAAGRLGMLMAHT